MLKIGSLLLVLIFFAGCGNEFKYTKPSTDYDIKNSIILNKSKDEVWAELVPALSQTFFVINNIDKESGLINVSYSGDPAEYIDCGIIYSMVKNLAGERKYCFHAASGYKEYEVWFSGPRPVKRKMQLEGRININVQEVTPEQTKVSVYTKYIVNREFSMLVVYYTGYNKFSRWDTQSDSVSFTTGEIGKFSNGETECRCNGKIEQTIIDLLE